MTKSKNGVSVALFIVLAGLMFYLRLVVFQGRFISLSYGLPLLLCFWHRDRRLLWSLSAAFAAMTTYKSFVLLPKENPAETMERMQWAMQVMNIVLIAGTIHVVIDLTERLKEKNAELEQANEELAAREEEISHQNEELQSQSEELAEQNEELQQQTEEVQQQSEEIQAQSEELQHANAELRQREAILQALLESLSEGADSEILSRVCRFALELVGSEACAASVCESTAREQLTVLAHAGLNGAETISLASSFAAIVMKEDRPACIEDLDARPDLTRRPGLRSVLAAPLRLSGKVAGVVEIYARHPSRWSKTHFRIVEWVAAQCALIIDARRASARLEEAVAKRTAQLQELIEELEHFSYTITHDMRAPLRAMQGFASSLVEEPGDLTVAERADYLRRIVTAAARMDRLITDALSYSKAGRAELSLEVVSPTRLLSGMLESYPEFQTPRADVLIEHPLPPVLANEAGLTQCFSNLLNNAVKFVEPGRMPRIRVRAETQDGRVKLQFDDNGIGVPVEVRPKLFRMFQRGTKGYEGTGMGLALVRKVVERMGGSVGVDPLPEGGSRFWLALKAAQ